MKRKQRIAIRELVEFILKRGSIDTRHTSEHTALDGARIHRKLQKDAGNDYQKEQKLAITVEMNQLPFVIEGRADGIFMDENQQIVIDEIKTSEPAFVDLLSEQMDMFWYQVMCYGHIYCQQEQLSSIYLQVTYFQTTTEEITRKRKCFSQEELALFFSDLIKKYEEWLIFKTKWRLTRNQSLKKLTFPYGDYRKGQRELAVSVYKTILSDQRLFVEAPTGTGKTISTLFPSLKALGEEQAERVFYFTAKTITRQVVEDAIEAMRQKELQVKSVTLTAKDKICFLSERNCTPDHCPFANGYYDRLDEGLWDLLTNENQFSREVIERYAKKYMLCPFELSLDISLWCDVIICDYNYLFDPTTYLRRFFEKDSVKKESIFLIDEVHNLVSRSREMYSASLSLQQLNNFGVFFDPKEKRIIKAVEQLNKEFEKIKESFKKDKKNFAFQTEPLDAFIKVSYNLADKIKEWLPENQESPHLSQVLEFYYVLIHYLNISELYDDHYYTYVFFEKKQVIIKQFCIDPSYLLREKLDKSKASILFSASLSPLEYYQEILGGKEDSLRYRILSPFSQDNQLVLIGNYVQTTYKERVTSYQKITDSILTMINQKKGNYLVFFPSYAYMDIVYEQFKKKYPTIHIQRQNIMMTEEEREEFLQLFKANPKESFVGFCVLGGIFSEGIDLKGSRLIGTVIVGVGLPQMNHEQELIKTYYDVKNDQGFQFSYQIPGMNKVLQAAGRVIRDEKDQGVVLLLDQRFSSQAVKQFFPPHWCHGQTVFSNQQMEAKIKQFWIEK